MAELDQLETKQVVDRDHLGRLLPGQRSINPQGRPKAKTVGEQLHAMGFDCIEEAIALYQNEKTSTYIRWDILKELLSYQYSKLKHVTLQNPDGEQASIKISWDTQDTAKQQFVNAVETVESEIVNTVLDEESSDGER